MLIINTCIISDGIRYIGALHYSELYFDHEKPDTKAANNIIASSNEMVLASRSKQGLIPLTKDKYKKMAQSLVECMKHQDSHSKPIALIDFDKGDIYANTYVTNKISTFNQETSGPLNFHKANQKQIDDMVLLYNQLKK